MAGVDVVRQDAPQDVRQEAERVGTADIVLGVLSYNNAATIAHVIRTAQDGLAGFFPGNRCVIVHADGGSKDGTPELALAAAPDKSTLLQVAYPVYPVHRFSPDYHGIPGKGNAVRAVFELAQKLQAK